MTDEIHKIDRGSPWEPSRGCLPDEIADERVADGMREWRRSVAGCGHLSCWMLNKFLQTSWLSPIRV